MNQIEQSEMISVIIPTYKNRGGLTESIDSVLNQTCSNIEVIVVDDNQPQSLERKETESLMTQYKNNDKVIYIRHEENKNGAAARNTGIKASKGAFIAFLDDDDMFLPQKLKLQLDYLKNNPSFDAVYCFAQKRNKPIKCNGQEGNLIKELLLCKTHMFTPTLLFRKSSLLSINGFDENFRRHQDYDVLIRFFNSGYTIGCVKEVLAVIGENRGENIPSADNMSKIKKDFFEKFSDILSEISIQEPNFYNKALARHYVDVFLSYLKEKKFGTAVYTFNKYWKKSPKDFTEVLLNHIKAKLIR